MSGGPFGMQGTPQSQPHAISYLSATVCPRDTCLPSPPLVLCVSASPGRLPQSHLPSESSPEPWVMAQGKFPESPAISFSPPGLGSEVSFPGCTKASERGQRVAGVRTGAADPRQGRGMSSAVLPVLSDHQVLWPLAAEGGADSPSCLCSSSCDRTGKESSLLRGCGWGGRRALPSARLWLGWGSARGRLRRSSMRN